MGQKIYALVKKAVEQVIGEMVSISTSLKKIDEKLERLCEIQEKKK